MLSLLAKIFIKDHNNFSSPNVRKSYGMLCGGFGIFLNALLFGAKLIAGMLTGSIAVTADAFNNLSDAGSSAITLLGFKISGQKPDEDHPFGHGRYEYICGLVVSLAIILMGFELLKSSVMKIFSAQDLHFSALSVIILSVSILVKLYMYIYNKAYSKKLSSAAMAATATDSLSDTVATFVVLLSTLVSKFFEINIDSYCGTAVAIFILIAGIRAAKDTISPLLGQVPDKEFVERIEKIVLSYDEVLGIHDLIVHDYGPGRVLISLHAEVSSKSDLLVAHDLIDNIETLLENELGCEAVIHMDPIDTDDEFTHMLRQKVCLEVQSIDPALSIHDFRIVTGPTHTNIIFDLVVPHKCTYPTSELKSTVCEKISQMDKNYFAVIKIEKSYT